MKILSYYFAIFSVIIFSNIYNKIIGFSGSRIENNTDAIYYILLAIFLYLVYINDKEKP